MIKNYDAIVIGAGVLGASAANSLSKAGYSVLILEENAAAGGASGGNLGQTSISDRWEPWHLPIVLKSLDYYQSYLSKRYDIAYVESGGTIALNGKRQIEDGIEAVQRLQEAGIEACIYKGGEMSAAEPNMNTNAAEAAVYCPREGKLDPFAVTLAFLEEAKKNGADLLLHTPVGGFEIVNKQIHTVMTGKGDFSGRWIINCAGAKAGNIGAMAGVRIPICFHKGTAFVTAPVKPFIKGPVCGGGFLSKETNHIQKRHIGFSAVQTAHGSIIIGQATESCHVDDCSINTPSLCLTAQKFLEYFPQLGELQILRAWAAVTPYTQDGLPVFGFSRQAENLLTAAGFKGAFSVAPEVGNMILSALEGHIDEIYAGCSPDRGC